MDEVISELVNASISSLSMDILIELYIVLSDRPISVTYPEPAIRASAAVESIKKGASVFSLTKSMYFKRASGVAPKI